MNEELIANILMIIGEAILFVASSRKNKKDILLLQIVSMVIMGIASYLLKGYSAIVMDVIAITRNILSIRGIGSRFLSYTFIAMAIIFGVLFNNNGIFGYLPIIANVTQSVFILNSKASTRQIRIACAFSSASWTIYNIIIKGYAGAVTNMINAASYFYNGLKDEK